MFDELIKHRITLSRQEINYLNLLMRMGELTNESLAKNGIGCRSRVSQLSTSLNDKFYKAGIRMQILSIINENGKHGRILVDIDYIEVTKC